MASHGEDRAVGSILARSALDDLIQVLRKQGYSVLGPRVVDGAISLAADRVGPPTSPRACRTEQDGGSYRVVEGEPELTFQYVVGPDGPKRYLFPANLRLFEFHVEADNFVTGRRSAAGAQAGDAGGAAVRTGGHRGPGPRVRHGRSADCSAASPSRGTRRFARRPC